MSPRESVASAVFGLARDVLGQAREQIQGAGQPLERPQGVSELAPVLGAPGLPFIGETLEYWRDPVAHGRGAMDRYGPVSWTRLFGTKVLYTLGPDAAEEILVNRDKAFANGPAYERYIGPFFERGLMLLDFEEHLHHRRIMQQTFKRERLIGYLKGINAQFAAGYADWRPDESFRFHPAFKQLTLNLANTVFVGHELGPEADRVDRAFFDAVQAASSLFRIGSKSGLPFGLRGGRWQRGLDGRRVLERVIRAQLPSKRAGGGDIFTALCHESDDDGNTFSDEDIVNHMIFLLMAAHDTSTTTTTTLVYHLGKDPQLQDRLREQSLALGTELIEFEDLARLPDLVNAIKESQRIVAPLPMLARIAVRDTTLLGHHVPAGTRLLHNVAYTMQMDEWFEQPARFDPDRFAPGREEHKGHAYAWMPFGGGVHKCIGMHFGNLEVTAAMHQLLLGFEWSVPDDYEMKLKILSLPYPADGLPIDLRRRA